MSGALQVALIGPGRVGAALLEQLASAVGRLEADRRVLPELRAVCDSRRMHLSAGPIAPAGWREALDAGAVPRCLDALTRHLAEAGAAAAAAVAIVDTTASEEVAARHATWLAAGYHVLTANKLASAGPEPAYVALRHAEQAGGATYWHETTVGAGLPVISVLKDFVNTGDEILAVEGVLSGSLSRLAAGLSAGERFSTLIRRLHEQGYTEPDPRIDLSGADVGRKLVILARAAGFGLTPEDVRVEPFLPLATAGIWQGTVSDFLGGAGSLDDAVAARWSKDLKYVATLRRGEARVGLVALPADDPLASLRPGDNLVRVTSRRYLDNPLVVSGPGAGRDVTAAGVLADLLRLTVRQPKLH